MCATSANAGVLVLAASVACLRKREVTDGVMWCFAKSGAGRPRRVCGIGIEHK